jgi:predicted dehydrogenase
MTGIAVVGTDHPHVVELTQQLVAAGAHLTAIVATENGIGPWLASQHPGARTADPFADDVDIVVTAAIPSERATIAIDAMRAGKTVVADKPGVTTRAQLDDVRAVQRETQQSWFVVFGERLGNAAMLHAERLVRAGAIGDVVHTVGLGPHTLTLKHRPDWFFDPTRYGGILVDIGSHQVDQFLAFTGAHDAAVVTAHIRAHDEHPGVQLLGEMLLQAPNDVTGYARVDYFTPKGLGAWGDTRFTVVGTAGTIDVRTVDNTVFLVDGTHHETIDATTESITWAHDVVNGHMPVDQAHVFAVHDVCLRAQATATATG